MGIALSRAGGKRRLIKVILKTWLLFFALSFSFLLSAAPSHFNFSCKDYSKILGFVQKEHLRFSVMNSAKRKKLTREAIKHMPDTMRELGYYMLAADFEKHELKKLVGISNESPEALCKPLQSDFYRLMMVKSFVSALDPYSDFYLEEEMSKKASVLSGHFVGVGVGTHPTGKYIEITQVIKGGPSDGILQEGDRIIKIDGHPVDHLSLDEIRRRIRGRMGSTVAFRVIRQKKAITVRIKRGDVFQKSVDYSWLDDGIINIKIYRFFAQTASKINAIMRKNASKIKGIVLDLRDDPGGLLQGARDVVDLFIRQGVVVYLQGNYNDQLWAMNAGGFTKTPMVVLINDRTASAAEIVAGALQDYGRAILVGHQSFGKSCVQNIYDTQTALGTEYRGGLKLTTLWYYLPSGRSSMSIEPDIYVPNPTKRPIARIHLPYKMPMHIDVLPIDKQRGRFYQKFVKNFEKHVYSGSDVVSGSEEIGKALLHQLLASTNFAAN